MRVDITNAAEDESIDKPLEYRAGWRNWVTQTLTLWKAVWKFLAKLKMGLHTAQQLHFWAFIPEKLRLISRRIYTRIFIAALFIPALNWKLYECHSPSEWLNSL